MYVSNDLYAHMKQIVPPDAQELFQVKHTEPRSLNMDIKMQPSEGLQPIDYNDPSECPSHVTDESFTAQPECRLGADVQGLIDEVDSHLIYLRERLARLNEFDEDVIQERRLREKPANPQTQFQYYGKHRDYSEVPTVDQTDFLNQKLVRNIEEELLRPSVYHLQCVKKQDVRMKVVSRQAGGPHTKLYKRNQQAFRRHARMLPRSAPRQAYADERPSLQVRSLQPEDERLHAGQVNVQEQSLGLEQHCETRENIRDLPLELLANNPATAPNMFATYRSVEDERSTVTELNLRGKTPAEVLVQTAQILEQLKTDE